MDVSILLCSHNSREEYLGRVLKALASQSLPQDRWELLLVDNASQRPVSEWVDLSAFSNARVLLEPKLGLTHARLCGFHASRGSILVFVDDDNVLAPNHLEMLREIFWKHSRLAAAGGPIHPEFSMPVPRWARNWTGLLGIRDFGPDEMRSAEKRWGPWCPIGAGLVVRREAMSSYVEGVKKSRFRQSLGRRGRSLMSSEDADLVYTLLGDGFETGVFPQLKITHLIPKERLQFSYMLRLTHSLRFSNRLLEIFHRVPFVATVGIRSILKFWFRPLRAPTRDNLREFLLLCSTFVGQLRARLAAPFIFKRFGV